MSKLTDFLADKNNKFHHVWEVEALLPAHDAEIVERAKAELFDQLYATAGTEALDAYRATHPGPLTALSVVEAIRQQAKREQMEVDCRAACWYCRMGVPMSKIWGGCHENIPDPDGQRLTEAGVCRAITIRAAWAKAHPEVKEGA